jgi:hypothetical protein
MLIWQAISRITMQYSMKRVNGEYSEDFPFFSIADSAIFLLPINPWNQTYISSIFSSLPGGQNPIRFFFIFCSVVLELIGSLFIAIWISRSFFIHPLFSCFYCAAQISFSVSKDLNKLCSHDTDTDVKCN